MKTLPLGQQLVTGGIDTLGSASTIISRTAILDFAIANDQPAFEILVNADDTNIVGDSIIKGPATITFDKTMAHLGQFVIKDDDIVGYIASSNLKDNAALDLFNQKLTNGALGDESFDLGFALVTTEKVAFIGRRGEKLRELTVDNTSVQAMRFKDDGAYLITEQAAYFIDIDNINTWLATDHKNLPIEAAVKVADFDSPVSTLSRPTDDNTFYVSGDTMSFKLEWNGPNAKIVDSVGVKRKVIGPMAGDNKTIVTGRARLTKTGTIVDLKFQPMRDNKLGYGNIAAA